jgi:hypothetical protein
MKQLAELVRDFPSEALQLFQSQRQVFAGGLKHEQRAVEI